MPVFAPVTTATFTVELFPTGARVKSRIATVRCAACDQENPPIARFCLACGLPLAGDAAPREERRIVTIIFVDLVGFTARSEALDPEDVRALLTPYHDLVRREIESFGGIVEKFIGDAIMGVFGAPVAYGDDAERAVRAALEVRDRISALDDSDLQIRIAVNTGEAVVTVDARPALGESMVAGDVVNTASRLQSGAPLNGVVVGEQTYGETRAVIRYAPTDPVVAKGKSEPLRAWVAVAPLTDAGERQPVEHAIVGRTPELALLRALWSRVATERVPQLVSIFGPAGIGKTTLAASFASEHEADGARVVRGRSLPYRESGTYGALATQMMHLCGCYESDAPAVIDRKLHERARELIGAVDDADVVAGHLGAVLGIDAGQGAADRDALFASTRRFIEAAAREQPTILVFEDIHWADPNLLDLIETLAMHAHGLPLLLLTLARPELLDARPGWGGRLASYTSLTLGPLGEADAHELAVRRLAHRARADEIVQIAEGNPLFIEQLTATVGETSTGALPTSIRALVSARLDALPTRDRALLLDAAVIGKVFWADALAAVSPGREFEGVLDELERRDLIRREPASILEHQQQFAFTHVLIRDVAYELLPRSERARKHARAAEFFERSTGTSAQAIGAMARHWLAAGENERALEQLTRAAEQAERGWAKDHAALLYREALELVPVSDTERRTSLRRRLALASTASFHLDDVRRPGSPQA
jgi:class 3 adenylate cyclase/tetratricopeptide (TPR) repeat protein